MDALDATLRAAARHLLSASRNLKSILPGAPMMDSLQQNRHANLRHVLDVLERDGFASIESQGTVLGLDWRVLKALLKGDEVTSAFARELEWLTQRPQGWLDDDHRGERLDE